MNPSARRCASGVLRRVASIRAGAAWLALALVIPPLGGSAAAQARKTAVKPRVLPFISDDYEQALRVARAKQLPLFIESWAPW